jgi:FkbM family methyltransferase
MKITQQGFAVLENDTHISKWAEESGRLDHDQNMLPLILSQINKGDTVLDVGAYIGDHTIAYSKAVGENGKVIAFEPNEDAFECLCHNLAPFGNTELFNSCVGDSNLGKMILIKHPENIGMTYVKPGKGKHKVVTIDSLELERCDFIKIDVEGFELKVLEGAEQTIKKFRPKMLIEINDHTLHRVGITQNDIYIFLIQHDYSYKNIFGGSIYEPQFDLICTPK